jgi:hypothetical protein
VAIPGASSPTPPASSEKIEKATTSKPVHAQKQKPRLIISGSLFKKDMKTSPPVAATAPGPVKKKVCDCDIYLLKKKKKKNSYLRDRDF